MEWSRINNMDLHEVVSYPVNTSKSLRELPIYPTRDIIYPTTQGHITKDVVIDLGVSWKRHVSEHYVDGALSREPGRGIPRLITNGNVSTLKEPYQIETWVLLPSLSTTNIGDIQKLGNIQRFLSKKITGCKELQYWDRIKRLKILTTVTMTKAWVLLDYLCLEHTPPIDTKSQMSEKWEFDNRALQSTLQSAAYGATCYHWSRKLQSRSRQIHVLCSSAPRHRGGVMLFCTFLNCLFLYYLKK